MEFFTLKIGKF